MVLCGVELSLAELAEIAGRDKTGASRYVRGELRSFGPLFPRPFSSSVLGRKAP